MNYQQAKKELEANGQGQLLRFWERLDAKVRKALLAQIAAIDFKELARCKAMLPGRGAADATSASLPSKPGRAIVPTAPKVAELKGRALAAAVAAGAKELAARLMPAAEGQTPPAA